VPLDVRSYHFLKALDFYLGLIDWLLEVAEGFKALILGGVFLLFIIIDFVAIQGRFRFIILLERPPAHRIRVFFEELGLCSTLFKGI